MEMRKKKIRMADDDPPSDAHNIETMEIIE